MLILNYTVKEDKYENQYLEFLSHIKEQPALIIGKASLFRLAFFMSGYEYAFQELTGYRLWFNKEFQSFIENAFSASGTQHWEKIISSGKTDEEAFFSFFALLEEYRKKVYPDNMGDGTLY